MTLQEIYNKIRTHYKICIIPKDKNIDKRKYFVIDKAGMYIDCGTIMCRDCPIGVFDYCDMLFASSSQLKKQFTQLEFIFKGQK